MLDDDTLDNVESIVDDPLCPTVVISREERRKMYEPWKRVIIIKVLGRKVSLNFLRARLARMCIPKGVIRVINC